jgi:pimeloyl-ACP methyl ester carboxylesterase
MHTFRKSMLTLLISMMIATGCGEASPTEETVFPTGAPTTTKPFPTETAPATPLPPTPEKLADTPTPTLIPATATPDVPFEEVTFTTEDGVNIAATLFGEGDLAVLLLHMGRGTASWNHQEDWHPFARYLADQGYPALTIDFRGRGKSGGEFASDPLILDAQAALNFLLERGFERFVCIGAGVGGTTCMHSTFHADLSGIVVLSGSLGSGTTNKVTEADLAQLTIPKLYLYGEKDSFGFPEAMQKIYQISAEPKALITCDTAAHGSDLLNAACEEDIREQILSFLDEID